jgi:hypothetical protein
MAINADVPISTSDAYGEDSNPFQDNQVDFNFAPNDSAGGPNNDPTFSNPTTATSAAQSGNGLGDFSTTTLLIIGGFVLAGLWLTHRH